MNSRAFAALFRREVMRGRRTTLILTLIALGAIVLSVALPQDVAVASSVISIILGALVVFAPLGDVRTDKMQGHLEFDRVLPVSHRTIGAARLLGAGIRTLPILLFTLPLILTLSRGRDAGPGWFVAAIAIPGAAWLLLTAVAWALMAINVRWNLRNLWWLPMTLVFGPRFAISALPPAWKTAIGTAVQARAEALGAFAVTVPGIALAALLVAAIPVAFFAAAVALFATGLERYHYDASAAVPMLTAAPRRELGAIGRGPTVAVARYCLRLATEQSRRRLILLAVFVVLLVVGSPVMKDYARFYVRALAALIPGGIALQLASARARGHLEGIQQLPHRAGAIGAGYLLAVAVLTIPGTAVWVLARAVTGIAPTPANVLTLFEWLVLWSWLASVAAVWLTARRLVATLAIPIGAVLVWMVYARPRSLLAVSDMIQAFRNVQARRGAAPVVLFILLLMLLGLGLFARGLVAYQYNASPRKRGS